MRLVYLCNADLPSRAANSVHIMKMCAAFAALGHDVTLVAPRTDDPIWESPGAIFKFYGVSSLFAIERPHRPRGLSGEYVYAARCLAIVRRRRPDRIFSRYLLGSVAAALAGIPGGLELHQPVPAASRLQRRLFRWYLRQPECRRLVVITSPLRDMFIELDHVPADHILIAPDGADLPDGQTAPWRPASDRLQIGYVGHLYRGRGIELIVALAGRCPWADVHIVGGTESDIRRVRREASHTQNVTVHGFVPPSRAEAIRLGMDVLLSPYQEAVGLASGSLTTERWMSPLKIFEYMAAGKAIICSDLPILRDVLTPNHTALLCPPADVDAWASALIRLRDDSALRETLGRSARAELEAKYQWTIRAGHILTALDGHRQ